MAEFQRIMDVNYFGMVRVTKALIPHMFRGSQIVNIASIAGRISVGYAGVTERCGWLEAGGRGFCCCFFFL